jgi:multicomponent Na+:H+ antiporter subunit B
MTLELFLMILVVLMLISALIALETTNLLSSIISVGALGLQLCIAFLFLGALEIAITQIVVEVLLLIILIRATFHRDFQVHESHREKLGGILALVLILLLGVFISQLFIDFPAFGQSVMDRFPDSPSAVYLADGLAKTGAPNIISAVMLDFRALDALAQIAILFCAVIGALAILRRQTHKRTREKDTDTDAA